MKNILAERDAEVCNTTSSDRIQMLATLLSKQCINYKMLLHNIVDILQANEALTENAVLIITDRHRLNTSGASQEDFEVALVAVRCASQIHTAPVLIAALSNAMQHSW